MRILLPALLLTSPAVAQSEFPVLYNTCVLADTALPTIAATSAAALVLCRPIVVNPIIMRAVPADVAFFIILHEYAHLLLGHAEKPADPRPHERAADCLAARLLPPERVARVAAFMVLFPGDAEHDPGALRKLLIETCAATQ